MVKENGQEKHACSLVDCELISIQMNTTYIIVTNSIFNFVAFLTCNLDIYITADLTPAQREINLQLFTRNEQRWKAYVIKMGE